MRSRCRYALKWMFILQVAFALVVLIYLYHFSAPPIAKEMSSLISTFKSGDSQQEVHRRVKEQFPKEGFVVTRSSSQIGDAGVFCFEEWRLPRGYKLVVFYSANLDEWSYLSGLVLDAFGVPIEE